MKEALPVLFNEDTAQAHPRPGAALDLDTDHLGIVVLDTMGRLVSANAQARKLVGADAPSAFNGRVQDLWAALTPVDGESGEITVDVAEVGPVGVRRSVVAGSDGDGHVLLLRDGRLPVATAALLQEASRHRAFAFLARDWAHDIKGMLHVIRINAALLARLLQRTPGAVDVAVTRCLDTIPREVERLDRTIELTFGARTDGKPSTFDLGRVCERVHGLIAARASRQRVEVVLELTSESKDVVGIESQVQCALLNVLLNALEAMPEEGRLVISAGGDADRVSVRISDDGVGVTPPPDARDWRARLVHERQRIALGLHVARAIVESHDGRLACEPNVPRGTRIEITFPSATSTQRD